LLFVVSYFVQVNDRDTPTAIGTTNNDEMCNFYMLYWVLGNHPVTPQTCFSSGPPHWSWATWGLKNVPEEEASTL
jgi:peptidylglycine monooxygenase